jgi:adenylate cyclase
MRITYTYQGREQHRNFDRGEFLIGRLSPLSAPDIDLSDDPTVSRKHARIRQEADQFWIEDLKSTNGTAVDGELIQRARLTKSSVVRIGETIIRLDPTTSEPVKERHAIPIPASVVGRAPAVAVPSVRLPTLTTGISDGGPPRGVPEPLAARPAAKEAKPVAAPAPAAAPAAAETVADLKRRLATLFELPLQFADETRLDMLLQLVIQRVVNLIPGATRGALLLHDRVRDRLQLKASVPLGEVVVSETLARRVMSEGHGFILERGAEAALSSQLVRIETGMYAPLLLKQKPLGAVYVDNPGRTAAFSEDDMQFLLAASHYLALLINNYQLQEDLHHNSTLLERVSTKFPPKIQERLLDNVRHGLLRPGGEKSEITVLFCDLRDFTPTSMKMETQDVVQMLNEYFPVLVEAIFRYDGVIDKFAGDAIVAVFGSPEPDAKQQENALLAALAMLGALRDLNAKRRAKGATTLEIGIGVHGGEALHGFVGANERMEFTVVGEVVQHASLYCKGAHNGEVLIGPEIYQRVFKIIEAERINMPLVTGSDAHAYRVKGLKV